MRVANSPEEVKQRRRAYKRAWVQKNWPRLKAQYAERRKEWGGRNREHVLRYRTIRSLQKLYGITIEEYEARLAAQKGVCAICKRPPSAFKKRFSVDHNHSTGKIRALLCSPCNTGIGLFQDNPALCVKAARYLRKYQ